MLLWVGLRQPAYRLPLTATQAAGFSTSSIGGAGQAMFEERFGRFLQKAGDVAAFAKLPPQFGFAIEYTDSAASLRYYEPDFVAILDDGSRRLIETKGREDPDVAHKDRAARLWCENASQLTGQAWRYLKVPQVGFDKLEPSLYSDLVVFDGR